MGLSTAQIQARQHGAMEYSQPPADLDAVRRYRVARVREKLKAFDYAGILLFNPINTRYACDATNMQIWCTHYETRCVWVATDGPMILFDYAHHPHITDGFSTIDERRVHSSFYYFAAGERGAEKAENFGAVIADLVNTYGRGNNRLAIDRLSARGCDAIRRHGVSIHDGERVMELARKIKSAQELALMQSAIEVAEIGLRRMRAATKPGITENALWAELHHANIEHGGEWIETRLMASGPRTFPWFHESSLRRIEAGDMISIDTDLIGPYGYCADMSRSWICGEESPSEQQKRIYALAYEQIQYNKSILKPGMSYREVAEKAWKIPNEFVDYKYSVLMHGVGLADEYPAIKHIHEFDDKGYDGVLEENMTMCVESYIGSPKSGEGVKLEEQVLITADGIRQLTTDPLETDWL
ncbi:MAG: Xaa-Pro peptidase family protein [Gammaproteobacteria bacterium]|nr:Xaa-Pro peptidase family protein [Gammaproteobacteria bacterium]